MARAPKAAPTPPEPEENPEAEMDADDGGDDEDVRALADEFAAIARKVASIPDDIGDKLDRILEGQTHGNAKPAGQSSGTPGAGTPAGLPRQATPDNPVIEKEPQTRHWYYGPGFGRKR